MCFHFMPGLWVDDFGLEITESIRITETGYELLAQVPRRFALLCVVRPDELKRYVSNTSHKADNENIS